MNKLYPVGFELRLPAAGIGGILIEPTGAIALSWLQLAELETRWLTVLAGRARQGSHPILQGLGPVPAETLTAGRFALPLAHEFAGPGVRLELWLHNRDLCPHDVRGALGVELERFTRGDDLPLRLSTLGEEHRP